MSKNTNLRKITNYLTADNNTLSSNVSQTITGSLTVTGNLTAQQFIVSSSVTYLTESFASGSHKFGDSSDDNHNFTGSLVVSGSANPLRVGSNLLFVSSSGNVGIGTSTLSASSNYTALNINGTTGSEIYLKGSNVDYGYIYANSGAVVLATQTEIPLNLQTNATTRFSISSTGISTFSSGAAGYGITLNHTSENLRLKMGAIAGGIINIQGEVISNSAVYPIVLNYLGGNVGIGASTSPTYLLEVSTASGSQRIRVGTLQNNSNSATFEAITTASISTASAAFFRANAGGSATIGVTTYTKTGGDSGNFANLSNQANTVAIHITGGGNVLVGTETDNGKLSVNAGASSASKPTVWMEQGGAAPYAFLAGSDSYHGIVFRGNPTVAADYSVNATDIMSFIEYGSDFRFYKKQPGVLTNHVRFDNGYISAVSTTISSISDIRTKENVRNSEDGLNIITSLRPVRFDFKKEFNDGLKNQLGFVAQEIEEVFPEAVREWDVHEDGISYKTVGPAALIPVLVKAIQELSDKNTKLEEILQRNNIV